LDAHVVCDTFLFLLSSDLVERCIGGCHPLILPCLERVLPRSRCGFETAN
jgi:hypothetical protein